jgi:flavorubredoxin
MFTYLEEDQILFSGDFLGRIIAIRASSTI